MLVGGLVFNLGFKGGYLDKNQVRIEMECENLKVGVYCVMRVYVAITGDLFHYGHVAFLKSAKTFGTDLIVGVCSDADVSKYKRQPIMSLSERVSVIEACKYVDDVIPDAPAVTSAAFIQKNNIDVVVATKAYSSAVLQEYYSDPLRLNILELVEYTDSISTTQIIRRCYDIYSCTNGNLRRL